MRGSNGQEKDSYAGCNLLLISTGLYAPDIIIEYAWRRVVVGVRDLVAITEVSHRFGVLDQVQLRLSNEPVSTARGAILRGDGRQALLL